MHIYRSSDPVDHREAAYREGKQRSQTLFDSKEDSGALKDHSASFSIQRAMFLRLDLSKIKYTGTPSGAGWGDDSLMEGGPDESEGGPIGGLAPLDRGEGGGGMGLIGGLGALVFTSNNEKRPDCSLVFQWAVEEKMQALFTVTQVKLELMVSGVLILTNKALYFHPDKVVGIHIYAFIYLFSSILISTLYCKFRL
jgi:hypothetical protein